MQQKKRASSDRLHSVSGIFDRILPRDYRQKAALIEQFQQYFLSKTSDAVFPMVRVLNVTEHQLILALPSATLVQYLRLHESQLMNELEQQFGQKMEIKLQVLPEGSSANGEKTQPRQPRHFPAEVSNQLKRGAQNIEDDELRQSLLSLAQVIKED